MIVIPRLASLRVDGTQLQCKIEAEMWGAALTFEEVHLVNNYFDMVDNHAFFPFHTTLKVLNLGECQVGGRGNRSPSLGFCFFLFILVWHLVLILSHVTGKLARKEIFAKCSSLLKYNFLYLE